MQEVKKTFPQDSPSTHSSKSSSRDARPQPGGGFIWSDELWATRTVRRPVRDRGHGDVEASPPGERSLTGTMFVTLD